MTLSEQIWAKLAAPASRGGARPPQVWDAIYAVLDAHPQSVLSAGVNPEMFGNGRCACCHHPLICEYQGHLNGSRQKVLTHDHVDPHPYCATCHSTTDHEGHADWPCPTVQAIAKALGVAP